MPWCVVMHSFSGYDRPFLHVESFVVCKVGKMEQGLGWCESLVVSFSSSLVCFDGFIVVFFGLRNGKKERRREVGKGENTWSIKCESVEFCWSQRTNTSCKFTQVNLYIQPLNFSTGVETAALNC